MASTVVLLSGAGIRETVMWAVFLLHAHYSELIFLPWRYLQLYAVPASTSLRVALLSQAARWTHSFHIRSYSAFFRKHVWVKKNEGHDSNYNGLVLYQPDIEGFSTVPGWLMTESQFSFRESCSDLVYLSLSSKESPFFIYRADYAHYYNW